MESYKAWGKEALDSFSMLASRLAQGGGPRGGEGQRGGSRGGIAGRDRGGKGAEGRGMSSSRPKSMVLSELYGRLNLHLVRANVRAILCRLSCHHQEYI